MKIIRAWIYQEVEFESEAEFEVYQTKPTARNAVIDSKKLDLETGKIKVIVRKPYNNCPME